MLFFVTNRNLFFNRVETNKLFILVYQTCYETNTLFILVYQMCYESN